MKKMLWKILPVLFVLAVIQSCDEPIVVDESIDEMEMELKSASVEKTSYIVVLNDAELNDELSKLKGYEKRQNAVKAKSVKILKRAEITDEELGYVYGTALKGFSVKIPPGQLKKLQNDASVVSVEESKVISLIQPKSITIKGDVVAYAQTTPWGIARVNGGVSGLGKTAWIIDSGIDLDHPDLTVDASKGAYFVSRVSSADDDNGHGSHCAGIVAAKDNGEGVIGVAAGATVVPVKVLDRRGNGTTDGVIAGIDWVAGHAGSNDVANMSLGGGISTTLDAAVLAASNTCKFVLAAGNESDDADSHSPARVNGSNIYTISAMEEGDLWAYYSNYGNPPVDYCAPGSSIYSTYKSGGYATMSGTSMAAPHVTGILLLGAIQADGVVMNDPDNVDDPIATVSGGTAVNQAPTADFSFDATNLEVNFSDTSYDSDGSITTWNWDFGEGGTSTTQNPTYTYASSGTYTVELMVTDNDGATDSYSANVTVSDEEPPVGDDIIITATGSKVRGTRYITVTWSGANGGDVDIKLNGITEITTNNDGSETLNLGRVSGTFVVSVCETDGSACSNEVTVTI